MTPIELPFDPVAVRLGALELTWHGIFTSLGIYAGLLLAARVAPATGLASARWWDAGTRVKRLRMGRHIPRVRP